MKQNISSQFNYTVDLGVKAAKSTFKIKKSNKDKVTHILVIVFMIIMSAVLVWDIIRGAGFVIDLIILIALVGVEIFSLIMPKIIVHIQKKFLTKLNLEQIDYTITEIKNNKCTETYYKQGKIAMQNVCDMSKLYGYVAENNYIFTVFDNFACAIFDLTTLNVEKDELISLLDQTISKNRPTKK